MKTKKKKKKENSNERKERKKNQKREKNKKTHGPHISERTRTMADVTGSSQLTASFDTKGGVCVCVFGYGAWLFTSVQLSFSFSLSCLHYSCCSPSSFSSVPNCHNKKNVLAPRLRSRNSLENEPWGTKKKESGQNEKEGGVCHTYKRNDSKESRKGGWSQKK